MRSFFQALRSQQALTSHSLSLQGEGKGEGKGEGFHPSQNPLLNPLPEGRGDPGNWRKTEAESYLSITRCAQAGFTLIEIMVVLVIISIIAVLVVPNILSRPDEARAVVAKSDIQAISDALELYKLDNFTYPSTEQGLEALVNKPDGTPDAPHWKSGGYLKKLPIDPWGNPYQYLSPGSHGEYDLWSFGSKGKQGGDDTKNLIGNWQ